jgi:hypothetical protein
MAANIIDIEKMRKIFGATWGFIGLPFPEMIIKGLPTKQEGKFQAEEFNLYDKNETVLGISELGVQYRAINSMGSEVFMPVWLSEHDRNATEYLLPNTVMSITSRKNIVTTPLVNRDGSVKEEISLGDWEIQIRGVLIGRYNNYPEAEKQIMVEWYKRRKAFNIQNVRTAICLDKNEKVVITELKFPEIRGFENTQPYEMRLLSDLEFSLYVE